MNMKSFYIVGKNKKSKDDLKKTLKRLGCQYKILKPEMIISLGGDGTYIYSERIFPGIPKLLIRDSDICKKCNDLGFDELFMKILINNYVIVENIKLEAVYKRKKYYATNDFIIRNKKPTKALRFNISIDNKPTAIIIGDGIVAATPFGSTGYYNSISRNKFSKGIGLAFNNTTKPIKHRVLHENTIIKLKLLRNDAHFGIDNDPKVLTIKEKETVTIKRSKSTAKIIRVI